MTCGRLVLSGFGVGSGHLGIFAAKTLWLGFGLGWVESGFVMGLLGQDIVPRTQHRTWAHGLK